MNRNRIKLLICLGVIFAIVVGLIFGRAMFSQNVDEDYSYLKEFEKVVNTMTTDQKIRYLQDAEEMLECLQKEIDSEETNAEERFEARRAYRLISKECDIVRKNLKQENHINR